MFIFLGKHVFAQDPTSVIVAWARHLCPQVAQRRDKSGFSVDFRSHIRVLIYVPNSVYIESSPSTPTLPYPIAYSSVARLSLK